MFSSIEVDVIRFKKFCSLDIISNKNDLLDCRNVENFEVKNQISIPQILMQKWLQSFFQNPKAYDPNQKKHVGFSECQSWLKI